MDISKIINIMQLTLKQNSTKKDIQIILDKLRMLPCNKGVNSFKYCGKLNIKEDAIRIQKRLRNEFL